MPERPGATTAAPAFQQLLELQDVDTRLAQARHRLEHLPERRELEGLEARRAELAAQAASLEGSLSELSSAQAHLDERVQAAAERQRVVEERLYAARGGGRDLEAMGQEAAHLEQRRRSLEDDELIIMEQQEPLQAERARLAVEEEALARAAGTTGQALAVATGEAQSEIDRLDAERAERAATIPAPLLERYARLRTRLGGTGAARLIGDHCDGCHLALPAMEVERVRRLPADEVVTCDNCGRILVRTAPGPA